MALIPTKRELGPLERVSQAPGFSPAKMYEGAALADLGNAAQDAGNTALRIAARAQEERDRERRDAESHRTVQGIQQLEIQGDGDLAAAERDGREDGFGLQQAAVGAWQKRADALLEATPPELKEKTRALLETRRMQYEQNAGQRELAKRDGWYRTGITTSLDQAQGKVFNDPAAFDAARDEVLASIRTSSLAQPEKTKLERDTREALGKAKFMRILQDDPAAARSSIGVAAPPRLLAAVTSVESGGRSDVISPKGAAGPMQVMPETGKEIADELDDPDFPSNGTTEQQQEYLSNPAVSGRYGSHYLNKMLSRYQGDEQAALIAYNGGPARADAWLASGRDDASIPKESADYYKKVQGAASSREPGGASLPLLTRAGKHVDMAGVRPDVVERFTSLQNQWGHTLPISSGARNVEYNKRVGGADKSQHIHGNALDVDVSKLSKAERTQLIGMASAMGFTGIGVYNTSVHLDMGGRRAWGPSYHSDSIPDWAKGAIDAHLAGKSGQGAPAPGSAPLTAPRQTLDPAYADISFADRLTLAGQADRAFEERQRQSLALSNAAYADYKGGVEIKAALGEVSQDELLTDTTLKPGDVATLLRRVQAGEKERAAAGADFRDLVSGAMGPLNPRDSTDVARVDKAYATGLQLLEKSDAPEAQRQAFTIETIRQTQVLPRKVQATIEGGVLDATSAPALAGAMTGAMAIEDKVPAAFKQLDQSAQKAVADYRHLTLDRGLSAEAAAAKILESRAPASKQAEELYGTAADKAVKDLTVSDVQAAFDPGMFSSEPGPGAVVANQNALMSEYQEEFRSAMLQTQGDPARAKAVALAALKKTWDISEVSGSKQLMKLPPEKFYPQIDGGFSYLRDDALKTAQDWFGSSSEVTPAADGTKPVASGRKPSNVFLMADGITARDVDAKRRPSYLMMIELPDANGDGEPEFQMAPRRWAMPDDGLKQLQGQQTARDAELFQMRNEEAISRPTGRDRDQSLDAFLDGPVKPPAPAAPAPRPVVANDGRAGRYGGATIPPKGQGPANAGRGRAELNETLIPK